MRIKYYITKKSKNGLNIFHSNRNFVKNKSFTASLDGAYFYHNREDAVNTLQYYDGVSIVDSNEASILAHENVDIMIASHSHAM